MAENEKESDSQMRRSMAEATRRQVRGLVSLPPLPRASQELLRLLSDPYLDMLRLAELVEQTPALAARIVGVANSAFFATATPVRDVPDAIIRVLGLNLVRDLGISFVLSQPFDCRGSTRFDPVGFWTGSMELALLLQLLAARLPPADGPTLSEAYLAGLLRDLGLLALVHLAPDAMDAVLAEAESQPLAKLYELESRLLGLDHAMAGAELATAWNLPANLAVAMGPLSRDEHTGRKGATVALVLLGEEIRSRLALHDGLEGDSDIETHFGRLGLDFAAWPQLIELWRSRVGEVRSLAAAFVGGGR
ncbi:MAG: HDOD domain-containing protein [Gammaproteobacteria bacterium]|nr:HDOD domain-containing protein [Gammaproteobacteria bacterium]